MSGASARRVAVAALIAATTLAVFWPVLGFGFLTYDDDLYVTESPHVQAGMTLRGVAWAWTTFHGANWQPLTWMSHMLDAEIHGSDPGGHHLTSLLLHVASALLLFGSLVAMTGSMGRCAFVAALFAVHPLHVESVAWVAERKDVLAGLFFMLALGAYARYSTAPSPASYLLVATAFTLGLTAKPTLVTLPLVLLLLDYWPLGRWKTTPDGSCRPTWRLVREKLPLLALSAASSVLTVVAQSRGQAVATIDEHSLLSRLSNALVSYAAYLVKCVWPRDLCALYPHPGDALPAWKVVAAAFALALVTAAAFRERRRRPYLIVGWLWYVGMLVPMIGLVQVGSQALADRYTYLPLIGPFVIVAWGGFESLGAIGRPASPVIPRHRSWQLLPAALVVASLAVGARAQVWYWRDPVTLFEHALDVSRNRPGVEIVHYHLAVALASRGDSAGAIEHYEASLVRDPLYVYPQAHAGLAGLLAEQGRASEAIEHYEAALRISPDFVLVRNNLANLLVTKGRTAEALEHYAAALQAQPDYVDAHNNIGILLTARGRPDDAIAHFLEALRIEPDSVQAHYGLGAARAAKREWIEAADHFSRAVRLKPSHAKAHSGLAVARFFLRDYPAAWEEVGRARQLGLEPPAALLEMLSERMPEPPRER